MLPVDFPDAYSPSNTQLLLFLPLKPVLLPLLQPSLLCPLNLAPTPNPLWSLTFHQAPDMPLTNFTVSTAFSFRPSSAVPVSFRSFCLIPVSHALLVVFPSSSLHSSVFFLSQCQLPQLSTHTPTPHCSSTQQGDVSVSSLNPAFILSSPSVSSYFHLCGWDCQVPLQTWDRPFIE